MNARRSGKPSTGAAKPRKEPSAAGAELAPCPRCGMNGGEVVEDGTSRFRYRVKCSACGWYTEFVSLRGVAVKLWNEAKPALERHARTKR